MRLGRCGLRASSHQQKNGQANKYTDIMLMSAECVYHFDVVKSLRHKSIIVNNYKTKNPKLNFLRSPAHIMDHIQFEYFLLSNCLDYRYPYSGSQNKYNIYVSFSVLLGSVTMYSSTSWHWQPFYGLSLAAPSVTYSDVVKAKISRPRPQVQPSRQRLLSIQPEQKRTYAVHLSAGQNR